MEQVIELPEMGEIPGWARERCRLEQTRLRNELAFIQGGRVHGGPAREELATAVRRVLKALAERLAENSSQQSPIS
jgi:hypothetical protein